MNEAVNESYLDIVRRLSAAQKGAARSAPAYSRFVNRKIGRLLAAAAYKAGWGVTLLVDSRYQEGTTRRDVIETQEVHPGVQG